MSSENLASHTLARHYPGGFDAFVAAMNDKARNLGMREQPVRRSHRTVPRQRSFRRRSLERCWPPPTTMI